MTFPFDIHIGAVTVPVHLIMEVLAFYFAYRYYVFLRKEKNDQISDERRLALLIGAAIGALVGSRLLGSFENLQLFFHPDSILYYYVSKTIVGGIIGGIIGVEIMKKIVGQKSPTGDLLALPLILGIAIGRVGCFLTGVSDGTAGSPSDLLWSFDQGDGISRHPTSLYELVFLAVLFFVMRRLSLKVPLKTGILFRLTIIAYLLFRFFIEFFKPVEHVFLGLGVIQIASLIFALYYIYTLVFVFGYRPFSRPRI